MEQINEHKVSLFGFNHCIHNLMIKLLSYYAKKYQKDIGPFPNDEEGFSNILKWIQEKDKKSFMRLDITMFQHYQKEIFTDDSNEVIEDFISFQNLDISALYDVLKNTSLLPTCKSMYRQELICQNKNHSDWSSNCYHKCPYCKSLDFKKSASGHLALNDSSYDQEYKNDGCKVSLLERREKSTVCCRECNECISCRQSNCINESIRIALSALENVKDLSAYDDIQIWEDLDNGTWSHSDFHNCTSWKELLEFSTDKVMVIAQYLSQDKEKGITQAEFEDIKKIIEDFGRMTKEQILEKYPKIFFDEFIKIKRAEQQDFTIRLKFGCEVLGNIARSRLVLQGDIPSQVRCAVAMNIKRNLRKNLKILLVKSRYNEVYTIASHYIEVAVRIMGRSIESKRRLKEFMDGQSTQSKDLWDRVKSKMMGSLSSNDIPVTSMNVIKWSLGSLHFVILVSKSENKSWSTEEKVVVKETFRSAFSLEFKEEYSIRVDIPSPKRNTVETACFGVTVTATDREILKKIEKTTIEDMATNIAKTIIRYAIAQQSISNPSKMEEM